MADVLYGNAGGNQLNAIADKTQVYGLSGNDTLISDGKSEVLLVGGSGDDVLILRGGNGTLNGGTGADTFALTYSATNGISAVIEDLEPARDKIVVNFEGDTAPQLTSLTSGDDVIWKDNAGLFNLTLKSIRQNDYFDGTASDEAWEVLKLTNDEREKENLSPLTLSEGLTAGASVRAQEIAALGGSGVLNNHTRPDGTDFSTVLDNKYSKYGENLDGGATSPAQVMEEWIGSTSHYANIMNTDFLKLGVGYNYDDSDKSDLRYYWTQLFADSLNTAETVSTAELLTAIPEVNTVTNLVTLSEDADTYSNNDYGATIAALGGDDKITNTGLIVSISGGAGNDTIENSGLAVTICAGIGNDLISLGSSAKENLIQYTAGDGSDTISGFNATSTLNITGNEYTPVTLGNDVVISVGGDSLTLLNAASLDTVNIEGTRSKLFILTEGDDYIENTKDGATINALGGNDEILNGGYYNNSWHNAGSNVIIDGGAGNDDISNDDGTNVTIDGGDGDDWIFNFQGNSASIDGGNGNDSIRNNWGNSVTINSGAGNDSIYSGSDGSLTAIDAGDGDNTIESHGNNVTINSGAGNDSIRNGGASVTIDSGAGNDYIYNNSVYVRNEETKEYEDLPSDTTINSGEGNDTIWNEGMSVTINSGAGNDSINNGGSEVIINIGDGNDSIWNDGSKVTINGGDGNDSIYNSEDNVTIDGGKGNDTLTNYYENILFKYAAGDGNDIIYGFNETSTLRIGDGTGTYSTQESGYDVIVNVGTGSIKLVNAAYLTFLNIEGTESESSGEVDDIIFLEDSETYSNTAENVRIFALGGDNYIDNSGEYVSISSYDGSDTIDNKGNYVAISSGDDNDDINNSGNYATINTGGGNDSISLSSNYNLIEYKSGDGSDTISGFNETDTLSISYSQYIPATVGNDVILAIDTDSITLVDAASLSALNILFNEGGDGDDNKLITLTEGNDTYEITADSITVAALGGDDTIINYYYDYSSISGGAGNDSIYNDYVEGVTIDAGEGDDSIYSSSDFLSIIDGGAGNDSIHSFGGYSSTIKGGEGDDTIYNLMLSYLSVIDGGTGDDSINNGGKNVTINGGEGNDTIINLIFGNNSSINGGEGNDYIDNGGESSLIDGGAGDDFISNYYAINSTINGGAGNDSISTSDISSNAMITGGTGDDQISLSSKSENNFIQYTVGDGNDTIWGFQSNDTLNISGAKYYTNPSGDDLIVKVGEGSITLKDARNKPSHIILGESGSSGGGSGGSGGSGSGSGSGGSSSSGSGGSGGGGGSSGGGTSSGSSGGSNSRGSYTNTISSSTTAQTATQQTSATTNQLWGNVDTSNAIFGGGDSDTFTGTDDADTFVSGKNQGSDTFRNISPKDTIYLNDVTLSDITAVKDVNGFIYLNFNTGNTLTIQSAELLSGAIALADGSSHRFNHMTRTWQ